MGQTTEDRPWAALRDDDRDGAYSDIPAFERWLVGRGCGGLMLRLGDGHLLDLYSLFCAMADGVDVTAKGPARWDFIRSLAAPREYVFGPDEASDATYHMAEFFGEPAESPR